MPDFSYKSHSPFHKKTFFRHLTQATNLDPLETNIQTQKKELLNISFYPDKRVNMQLIYHSLNDGLWFFPNSLPKLSEGRKGKLSVIGRK